MANQTDKRTEVPDEAEFLEGANVAVQSAIEKLHRAGISTVHAFEGRMVRIHPDGHQEDLGPVPNP